MNLSITDHRRDIAGLRYVYPVLSRRAGGISIGINLNPNNACNWRCIYCQVPGLVRGGAPPIDPELLTQELLKLLDSIHTGRFFELHPLPQEQRRIMDVAFSGNGEPTSAREFGECVSHVGEVLSSAGLEELPLRLITNGSLIHLPRVQAALHRLAELGGEVWFKLDSASDEGLERFNHAAGGIRRHLEALSNCCVLCPTWVQTCLFALDGHPPREEEFRAYLDALGSLLGEGVPLRGVLLYGLARPSCQPEAGRLSRLSLPVLEDYGERIRGLGLEVRVTP